MRRKCSTWNTFADLGFSPSALYPRSKAGQQAKTLRLAETRLHSPKSEDSSPPTVPRGTKISTSRSPKPPKLLGKTTDPHVLHTSRHFCTGQPALPPPSPPDTLLVRL